MMFQIPRIYLEYNDKLYIIKRTIKESSKPIVDVWKEHLSADIVLKKDGIFYFLQEVQEAQIELGLEV
jgi:hypothetical protein